MPLWMLQLFVVIGLVWSSLMVLLLALMVTVAVRSGVRCWRQRRARARFSREAYQHARLRQQAGAQPLADLEYGRQRMWDQIHSWPELYRRAP